jgi:hypothetical protein
MTIRQPFIEDCALVYPGEPSGQNDQQFPGKHEPSNNATPPVARPEAAPGEAPLCYVAQADPMGCGVACLAMVSGRTYGDVRADITPAQIEHGLADQTLVWWLNRHAVWHRRSWMDGEGARPAPTSGVALMLTHDAHWVVLVDGAVLDPARPTPLPRYDFRQAIEVLPPSRLASLSESLRLACENRALAEGKLAEVTAEQGRLQAAVWAVYRSSEPDGSGDYSIDASAMKAINEAARATGGRTP